MRLEERQEKQLLKYYQNDLENSMYWEKTLKYIAKTPTIEAEEVFAFIAEYNGNLKGLPSYMIKVGLIQDYNYVYKGLSIAIVFELFNKSSNTKNLILANNGKYLLNKPSTQYFDLLFQKINNKELIKEIMISSKETLLKPFKVYTNQGYTRDYNNYLEFFIDKKRYNLIDFILYELNFTENEIAELIYSPNGEQENAISRILKESELSVLKKLHEIYTIDYDKIIQNDYSYYYEYPIISVLLNEPTTKNQEMIDFLISINATLIPEELKTQTRSKDISFLGKKTGGISRSFNEMTKSMREVSSLSIKKQIKNFIQKTNTLEENTYFWAISLIKEKTFFIDLLNQYQCKLSDSEIKEIINISIYENNPKIIETLLKNNQNLIELFHSQNKYEKTLLPEILSNTTRDIISNSLMLFIKVLLDNGLRVNNHDSGNPLYEVYSFKNLNMDKELKELCDKYKDNFESLITFDIASLKELIKPFGEKLNPFGYIDEMIKQLKNILIKLQLFEDSYENFRYIREESNTVLFEIQNNSKKYQLEFDIKIINGNPLNKNSFKIEKVN